MLQPIIDELTAPFEAIPPAVAFIRLLAAIVLGGLIGMEREINAKSAGLRTHMMISLAACLFTLVTFELLEVEVRDHQNWNADPLRLIEAVTAGVAFLAAGSIITSGDKIRGLTTGAGMWLAGAVGLACGAGRIPLAALAAVMAIIILWLLRRASKALNREGHDLRDD